MTKLTEHTGTICYLAVCEAGQFKTVLLSCITVEGPGLVEDCVTLSTGYIALQWISDNKTKTALSSG